jgi:predicted Zn finger-like uncharacterized protein
MQALTMQEPPPLRDTSEAHAPPGPYDPPSSVRPIVCPRCETRFVVADAALGGAIGRRLRCAGCGHVWHYSPEPIAVRPPIIEAPAPTTAAIAAMPPGAEDAPRTEAQPGLTVLPRPVVASEPIAPARRDGVRIGILAVLLAAAVLALAVVLGRERIEALYPPLAPVYAKLGLAASPGAGLAVTVTPTRRADSLLIDGDIVNGAANPRPVPRLRLTLLDGNKIDLASKVIDPPVPELRPGATAHFNVSFEHPASNAVRVDVTFATD